MSRRGAVVAVVLLVAIGAGVVAADGLVRARVETEIGRRLGAELLGGGAPPDVTIGGGPFLPQVARGSLHDVRLAAPAARLGGLDLEDVHATLGDVQAREPYRAGTFDLTAFAPLSSVAAAAKDAGAGDLDLTTRDGRLVMTVRVLGAAVDLTLAPRAEDAAVVVAIESLTAGGVTLDTSSLPGAVADRVSAIRVPVDGLPDGARLTGVRVVDGGLDLTAAGTDVALTTSR